MMYYNRRTGELSSVPPWGNTFLSSSSVRLRYPDLEIVPDDFVPPAEDCCEILESDVSGTEIDMAEALVEIYDILEERGKNEDL